MQLQTSELTPRKTVKLILEEPGIKDRFNEILGEKAVGFIASIISTVNASAALQNVDQNSIVAAAAIAATLDLPINQNLGFAYIIPYLDKAQFQMGYKGFIQLAIRTGQYKFINATRVYDGQLKGRNLLTGEIVFEENSKISDKVIGYASYFELLSGFKSVLYMTVDEITAHGKRYSKSFNKSNSQWQTNFDGMALKTVVKLILSKWGVLSIQMQKAIETDQAIISQDGNASYIDNESVPVDQEELERIAADFKKHQEESTKNEDK